MRAAKTLITAALMALAVPALAGTTLLDFESVSSVTTDLSKDKLYAGLGINFTTNAWSAASRKAKTDPGEGYFYRGLDANGFTNNRGGLWIWDGDTDTGELSFFINVAKGFNTEFGLSYTTGDGVAGRVEIYSEENGKGELVNDLALASTGACPADPSYLCKWNDPTISLNGKVGKSIRITGANTQLIFDDFRFQLNGGGTQVPEPGGVALSLAALGALAWSRKRKAS